MTVKTGVGRWGAGGGTAPPRGGVFAAGTNTHRARAFTTGGRM